jgi:putative nucleotidyltransferase with HDIG domain
MRPVKISINPIIAFFGIFLILIIWHDHLYAFCQKQDCLAPGLQIPTAHMGRIYKQSCMPKVVIYAGTENLHTNAEYENLIKKIEHEVGTADELLVAIRKQYEDEFGQAIDSLLEREKFFNKYKQDGPDTQNWVIEHQKEVMLMSYYMGRILGLRNGRLARIAIAARFHDIGKCETDPAVINDDRLFAKALLSRADKEHIRDEIVAHAARSYEILREYGIKDEIILAIVFYHHANVDGSGYPDPITRQEIPLGAKITRVVDSFSAMLGQRPYPRPMQRSFSDAVDEIERNEYYFYGPRVVRTFKHMIDDDTLIERQDLYHIPLRENKIFRRLFKEAKAIDFVFPFAKVAAGLSERWNEEPFMSATNTIGTHRHAEVNLVLKAIDTELRKRGLRKQMIMQLRRLEFLAYTQKLNQSGEGLDLVRELAAAAGEPFQGKVIYSTLRPCAACLDFLQKIGIKEVYYGSDHPDHEFVEQSEMVAAWMRKNGMKVVQAHFANEGATEPNGLFFDYCCRAEYECIAQIINSWFAELINNDDLNKLPIGLMRKKEKAFTRMVNALLSNMDKETKLSQTIDMLEEAKEFIGKRGLVSQANAFAFFHEYHFANSI